VAVVTNFSPNHLDRHGTIDVYRRAKQTILRWQDAAAVAVLNSDDPDVWTWPTRGRRFGFGDADAGGCGAFGGGGVVTFRNENRSLTLPITQWCRLPGRHNLRNAAAAACAALAMDVDVSAVQAGIEGFRALPHRLQLVGEAAGRRFYNDSKATTPESLQVALEAFAEPIVLLAGGYDKHVDLGPMAESIARRARAVALMGRTADRLLERIQRSVGAQSIRARPCRSLEDAFAWAVMNSEPGDAILLSPGCASYDWFRDYRERGERFTKLARGWCARR
jgi:UDP-N-acetylmuramoylalanine--D-glutamate ligase